MNFTNHALGATVAVVMTAFTFGSIGGYAEHVAEVGQIASVQTVAAAQIDGQLQKALRRDQRQVHDNVVDSVLAMLPPLAVELPTVTVVGHRSTKRSV